MGIQNSRREEFFALLVQELVVENPLHVSTLSTSRDIRELNRRFENEGLPFLTEVLPRFWKAVMTGLETGCYVRPDGFKSKRIQDVRPAFLGSYVSKIFDSEGTLRTDISEAAVKHVYQVCYLLYKLELSYSSEKRDAVLSAFVQTESELEIEYTDEVIGLIETASHIAQNVMEGFDPYDISPRHGPGAVATGERGDEKWTFGRFYPQIDSVYPYSRFFMLTGDDTVGLSMQASDNWCTMDHGTAKVVLVPKDSRGPRLISCEPLEFQWIQQGLGNKLSSWLEAHDLTKDRLNFTEQGINRALALKASSSRDYATLDLEAASDRVSLELVELLLARCPDLLKGLKATRSSATLLPSGEEIFLKKFAPMGSALCFPVEALCFWCIAVAAIVRKHKMPLKEVAKSVYVYGDDIIAPSAYFDDVVEALQSVCLKVNRNKSFYRGAFRESCGMDACNGVQVTPVKLHNVFNASDPASLAAYASAATQLQRNGYTRVACVIWDALEDHWGTIPFGTAMSPFVCKISPTAVIAEARNKELFRHRWNEETCQLEFRVHTALRNGKDETSLDSLPRLLRNLSSKAVIEEPDVTPRPRSLVATRRWEPVSVGLTDQESHWYGAR
jgi:hypothetical protein